MAKQSHVLLAKLRKCCCSLVSQRSTNVAELRRMFKTSRYKSWYVPYDRPDMPAISETRTLLVVLDYFANFLHVSSVGTVKERPESSQSSNEVSSVRNGSNHSNVFVLIMALTAKTVLKL